MKKWSPIDLRCRPLAVALLVAWLPYATTRCLENPAGPNGAAGSVNCIFGHHQGAEPHDHHHAAAHSDSAAGDEHGGKGHDHSTTDTCCTFTGKSAVTLTSAPTTPNVSAAVACMVSADIPQPVVQGACPVRQAVPLAHAPPTYLLNAALLI